MNLAPTIGFSICLLQGVVATASADIGTSVGTRVGTSLGTAPGYSIVPGRGEVPLGQPGPAYRSDCLLTGPGSAPDPNLIPTMPYGLQASPRSLDQTDPRLLPGPSFSCQ
jgi:hypothetical protein